MWGAQSPFCPDRGFWGGKSQSLGQISPVRTAERGHPGAQPRLVVATLPLSSGGHPATQLRWPPCPLSYGGHPAPQLWWPPCLLSYGGHPAHSKAAAGPQPGHVLLPLGPVFSGEAGHSAHPGLFDAAQPQAMETFLPALNPKPSASGAPCSKELHAPVTPHTNTSFHAFQVPPLSPGQFSVSPAS